MRQRFFDVLLELSEVDDRIHLIVGDLGFGLVEPFALKFPDRFINAGVAEQSITGIAAGLAHTGAKVFTYSIANFASVRCLEQIRNDVCYHTADVKIVAVGAGLGYGSLGFSHHGTEDMAIMRSLTGMRVACPGDSAETEAVTRSAVALPGPVFLRIGRADDESIHQSLPTLEPGQSIIVRDFARVTLLANGPILRDVLSAAERLDADGISVGLVSVPWIKPIDRGAIERAAEVSELIVTVEEHSVDGGLGGVVAEVLADRGGAPPLLRLGIPPDWPGSVGSTSFLRAQVGLDAAGIHSAVRAALESRGRS